MNFCMILSNNNRSKVYLQNLLKENLVPSNVIYLDQININIPEQIENNSKIYEASNQIFDRKCSVSGLSFNEKESVLATLKNNNIPYKAFKTLDPNEPLVINQLKKFPEITCIYSGPGGFILRRPIFKTGKSFIHAHPGKLPLYRGSTTIYYSLLINKDISVSVIELNEQIDEGNIFFIDKYNFSPGSNIDYVVDNCVRAKSIIKFVKNKVKKNTKQKKMGNTFYIIHPVLKHLSIIKNNAY